MWIRFCYDAEAPSMNFRAGDQVEVPDHVARRWLLMWELFYLLDQEMGSWKARGWNSATKALPAQESIILPMQEVS